jgi:diguanylate cyclase (GGDEF)-like protein/PAS domain S-box-containing protein
MVELAHRLRSVSRSLAIATSVVAVLTLIGRLTERALPPVAKPIMLTTSASWLLLLASVSLLGRTGSWSRHGRTVGFMCGTAVIALAILLALPAAGPLMSPQSVTAFMFLGLGLLLLDWETSDGSRPAQAMSLLAAVIAFVPLLGYLYSVPWLYTIDVNPPIPVQESIALLLLAMSLLFARPDGGGVRIITSHTAGGFLARGMPIAAVALPMVIGWLILKGQRLGWFDSAAGISLFVFANIAFFSLLIFRVARRLDRTDQALRLSEQKFSGLFRSSPDAIAVVRLADGEVLEVNDGLLHMTGFSREDVVGRMVATLPLWRDLPDQTKGFDFHTLTSARNLEIQFRTKTGDVRVGWCSTESVSWVGEPCVLTVVRDISDRKHAQAALQDANERLARWVKELESRSRQIALLNDMGDLLQTCVAPAEACAVAVQSAQELLPGSSGAICTFVESANLLEVIAAWGDFQTSETMFAPQECWGLRRGRAYVVQDPSVGPMCEHVCRPLVQGYVCVPMMAQGEALGVLHVREALAEPSAKGGVVRLTESTPRLVTAISEHVALALANLRLRQRLRDQSIRDQLTGLFNRRYMEESLSRELFRAQRARRPVALVLMDLDRFKVINDQHGHEAGDKLLKAVSQLFLTQLRASDIACRYGGEEFVLVLPETTLQAAEDRADQLRSGIGSVAVSHRGGVLGPVTISAGVVAFPEHGEAVGDLLDAADAALYRAKAKGGNRIERGDPAVIVPLAPEPEPLKSIGH